MSESSVTSASMTTTTTASIVASSTSSETTPEVMIPTILTDEDSSKKMEDIVEHEEEVISQDPIQVEYVHIGEYLSQKGFEVDQSALEGFQHNPGPATTTVILTSPSNHQQVIAALVNQGADPERYGEIKTVTSSSSSSSSASDSSTPPTHLLQSLMKSDTNLVESLPTTTVTSTSQFAKLLPNNPVPIQVVKPQQKRFTINVLERSKTEQRDLSSSSDTSTTTSMTSASTTTTTTAAAAAAVAAATTTTTTTSSSSVIRRRNKNPIPDTKKDEKYWKRRMKNNMAARRSRESRKEKENEVTRRAEFLEKEYQNLSAKMELARDLNRKLRERLLKYEAVDDIPEI